MTFSISSFNLGLLLKAAFPLAPWIENEPAMNKWMISEGGAVCHSG